MQIVALLFGLVLVGLVLWDAFETIIVPRPTSSRFRIARHLIRGTWPLWRDATVRTRRGLGLDRILGIFAPASVVALLVSWLVVLIFGYGLVFYGLRDQLQPVPGDLGSSTYFAATSVLTLGFGDVVAIGPAARLVTILAAGTGLGIVALVITFLFSLFTSFQRREILIVTLQASAGAPPSAVALLKTYRRLGLVDELPALFEAWQSWAAEVLDSHVAYPLLLWFRSSHDNLSWISALGAVLDAATLILTTVRDVPRGHAELMKRVGGHFIEDITNVMDVRAEDGSGVERPEFDQAYRKLAAAGFSLEDADASWHAFQRSRRSYASHLEAMASYWAMPATRWIGETAPRESLVHERQPASGALRGS